LAILSAFAVSTICIYIVFAAGEKDLLDFAATLLGKILRRLRALEIIFDFANAPIREVNFTPDPKVCRSRVKRIVHKIAAQRGVDVALA
jgi:hypothetical protein